MTATLEKVTFRLTPDGTIPALQVALSKSGTWIAAQKGFEYSTVTSEGGAITHLVFWQSAEDAHAAQAAFPKAPENADLMKLIDGGTLSMAELPILHAFGPEPVAA